jgi:hypothetical protein
LSTVSLPSAATNSIFTSQGFSSVVEFSLSKKSPPSMWTTCALDPDSGHCCIILWGFFWANFFTEAAGLRSELP